MSSDSRLDDLESRWNMLRDTDLRYLDQRFAAAEALHQAQRDDVDRRLEAINEFRRQLSSQANGFLSREVYDAAHEALRGSMDVTRGNLDTLRTTHVKDTSDLRGDIASLRARQAGYTAAMVAIVSILTAVIAVIQITGK